MKEALHITSGDIAGNSLAKSGIPGDVYVWHDILYDGPRKPGWPDDGTLDARARFLEESTGGGLERSYIRGGCEKPGKIFSAVAAADAPPQYWGDITLWATINAMADRNPPLVRIEGPTPRLPQWEGVADLKRFRITSLPRKADGTGFKYWHIND